MQALKDRLKDQHTEKEAQVCDRPELLSVLCSALKGLFVLNPPRPRSCARPRRRTRSWRRSCVRWPTWPPRRSHSLGTRYVSAACRACLCLIEPRPDTADRPDMLPQTRDKRDPSGLSRTKPGAGVTPSAAHLSHPHGMYTLQPFVEGQERRRARLHDAPPPLRRSISARRSLRHSVGTRPQ